MRTGSLLLVSVAGLAALAVTACDEGPHHLEAQAFCELAAEPTLGSTRYVELKGVSDGRAGLVLHEMSSIRNSWGSTVYWSEADGLPEPCRARFRDLSSDDR